MWARIWTFLDWCFFGPASDRPGVLGATLRLLRYPYAVVRDLARGEINLRAMGLVYTTLLSLIPLLAFSLSILRIFGGHRDIEPIVYEFFRPVGGAAATELTGRVVQFAHRVSSGVVGSVGLALLAWTLVGTIKKVEDSFNFLWHVDQPRSFARRIAEYTTLLIAGPVLLVAFVGVSHAALASAPVQEMVRLPLLQRLRGTGISLAPYAMVTAFFTALYMLVPNTRVQWRAALTGAVVGGVLWAAIGKMFTALVVYSTRLTIVYAGFAFVVAALLWTYFGWLILLAGAQLSFYVQNPSYLRLGLQQLRLSSVELEQLALKLMYFVGRSHVAGGRRWTRERPRQRARAARYRRGADGGDARAGGTADRDGLRRAGAGARHLAHRRTRDPRHRAQPAQRARRPAPPADPAGGPPAGERGRGVAQPLRQPHAAGPGR